MANLSSLVHELRERIAATSSTPPTTTTTTAAAAAISPPNDDALELRFRAVLPNLLHTYVVPSPSANEREAIAVLKLISHTAKNFPGVFYHGKASAILPVIGRVLPFFAEPSFRSRHGVIFETIGSLLSLLRGGSREAYRQFFVDAMVVVEDILYVASLYVDNSNNMESASLNLKCFCESFAGIFSDPDHLGDLPASNKPADGVGIMINLTGKRRWRPFATWIIKLINKCLTDGTLYVEGLMDVAFVSAACSLLCYGDADLHMACFDFARIVGSVINYDIIPHHNLIQSITTILSEDKEGLPVFRNTVYDSSMGGCLNALYSSCADDVVKLTAAELVGVFPQSIWRTKSQELKVALCNAYKRIAQICPPHVWKPESLIRTLCFPEPCFPLIDCFRVALSILGPDRVGGKPINYSSLESLTSSDKSIENLRVGEKRPIQDVVTCKVKRQKLDEDVVASDANVLVESKHACLVNCETEEKYAIDMHKSLISFVKYLNSPAVEPDSLSPGVALTALSMLCIAFCRFPETNLSVRIFQQMYAWIPLICEMAKQENSITLDVFIYLEGIHSILLLQSTPFMENKLFKNTDDDADLLHMVLKLPWTHSLMVAEPHHPWKTKCISVQVASKLGPSLKTETDLEILDFSLHDEVEEVRVEAVLSMPVIVLWSGLGLLTHIFRRLELLGNEKNEKVKNIIPLTLGFLSCLYGSCNAVDGLSKSTCKLFLNINIDKHSQTVDYLLQGFWCSKCDRSIAHNPELYSKIIHQPDMQRTEISLDCDFLHLQSLFFKLLYDESSEEVQVACVGVIRRILTHGNTDVLLKTRSEWTKCIEFLLLNRKKAVREAFCSQINSFLEDPILPCLFYDEEKPTKIKEQKFLDVIKHALSAAEDPQIFDTLLESTAAIMIAVDIHSQLFLFSLFLLVDQLDNPHVTVRMNASRLIHKSCYFHLKGGFELVLSKVVHIRNELFDYLSLRLASRPKMVKEFAEAVFGVETEELVRKMIPIVLPKLVVSQQDNDQAIETLDELAKYLSTDMVPLIVNWLPKVLAFALHQADGQELLSALQFYLVHTGSDKQEIFAAALPALLDELVCFLDGGDSDEIRKRIARVPQMIKEVARVLTGGEDLPGFLRNHFVGLLNSIDRKMLHAEDTSLQQQALKRIEMLIEMMGSHLSTYVPKLMVLLMHAIDKEPLQSEGLSILLMPGNVRKNLI